MTTKVKKFSNSLDVFPIGIGTFPFDEEVWGPIDEKGAIDILLTAYEKGVNYFNSAYYYGKGRCEKILGKAVKKMDREKVVVATKVGTEFGEFSLKNKGLIKSIGISNFPINLSTRVLKMVPIRVFEFYFSLLNQKEGNKILKFCRENGIIATPYKVIERGIL